MKKRTLRLAAAALALALTGCAAADTSTAAQIEMRVQDGYIQYYNGTDWENLISTEELKGEKGDKGDKGDPGEKGERGETGPQGAKGDKGDPGVNGINGQNGADGANGKDGANGQNGTNGKNGVDGKNGADGRDGVDGKDGLNGKDGVDGKDGRDGIDGKDGRNGVDGKDGKDGIDGKDGRDGVDGKDGTSTVPGITQEFICNAQNYYYTYDSTSTCGYIQVNSAENVLPNQRRTINDAANNQQQVSFLMNEDGRFTVTAVAESGWQFVKWSDGQANPSRTITYTDNATLHAYFEPVTPPISWDSIKPLSGSAAELSHLYSSDEPWVDILYVGELWTDSQRALGSGLLIDKGENDQLGKYVSIKHSSTTTIRYGCLSDYPSDNINSYVDGYLLSLVSTRESSYRFSTLRIQVLVNGEIVNPETVLPKLSTVDWLYAKGEAPRPTPTPTPEPPPQLEPTSNS